MMEENDNQEFEKYLKKELSEEEAEEMARQVEADPQLKAKLLNHLLAEKAIEHLMREKVKKQLDQTIEKHGSPSIRNGGFKWNIKRIAAAAAVLLMAGFSIWLAVRSFSGEDQFITDYYILAAAPTINRSGVAPTEENQKLQQGRNEFYVKENFRKAIKVFESIPAQHPDYQEGRYYLGHSHLRLGHYKTALEIFQGLLSAENLPAYIKTQDLQWNLLLCYRAAKRQDDFKQLLDQFDQGQEIKEPYKTKLAKLKSELSDH